MMGAFYYAATDENGVLCVDELSADSGPPSFETVAKLAEAYPGMIYFWHWAGALATPSTSRTEAEQLREEIALLRTHMAEQVAALREEMDNVEAALREEMQDNV